LLAFDSPKNLFGLKDRIGFLTHLKTFMLKTLDQNRIDILGEEAINLLKDLIAIPSFSKEEGDAADRMFRFLSEHSIQAERHLHNVWAKNKGFDPTKPSILLNSHLDTVKPSAKWTKDSFTPVVEAGQQ
jgi:acetylornithine deacetylase